MKSDWCSFGPSVETISEQGNNEELLTMGSFTHFMVNWSTTTWGNGEGNWKYVELSRVWMAIYS